MTHIIDPLPLVIQAPRVFAGQIQFGDVTQSSDAFRSVNDSLSFFRAVYDSFASYRAAIIRLDGLITANEQARALPTLTTVDSVSHRGTVEQHHDKRLELLGDGQWRLGPIAEEPLPV